MDALVRHLLDLAEQRVPPVARGVPGRQLAVAAVGGYGRAQLAPASDLDLLFLIPPQPSIHSIQAIEFVLYRLWDLGLRVGHAVRSCGECVSVARSDWRTATSLLDLRHLWGRRPLYDALESSFRAEVAKNGEVLISALLCDLAKRRARFRDPEAPDLKRGPGGLRDLQTLCWLAKIRRPLRQPDLTSAAALDDSGARDAIGFLWSVRCHLHYLSGGAQERLSLDLQPEIARRMLGKALPERRSTAAFMRRFWRASRWVEGLSARWLRQ